MSNSNFATAQIAQISDRIAQAADSIGRNKDDIRLVGASKFQSADLISSFNQLGLSDIGENYLNEAIEKQQVLLQNSINWHFIGRIQSNKTKKIATNFNWVHGVASLVVAKRLAKQNQVGKNLNILLQINIDQEDTKSGISPNQAIELCQQISPLPNLNLRGFMVLPMPSKNFDQQRRPFAATYELLERCNQFAGLSMDTLSMGMSADLEAAITEGSTMLRIGTDLFGPRLPKQEPVA